MQHQYTVGERIMGVAIEVLTGLEDQGGRHLNPRFVSYESPLHKAKRRSILLLDPWADCRASLAQMDQPLVGVWT